MPHLCNRRFFRLTILAALFLCVTRPFQEGGRACFAHARHVADARLWSGLQNADWQFQDQARALRLSTDIVTLSVGVTDKQNNFVPGLSLQDFEIYEDGVKQDIVFFSDDDVPLSIGILLDISGSLKKHFDKSLKAALELVKTSHPDDDFFLMPFSKKITVQVEGDDWEKAGKYLRSAQPEGLTAFYDAVYFGLEKVKQGKHRKRALIVISDGQDNSSRYKYGELMELVKEAGVQIYCVGIGDTSGNWWGTAGKGLLKDLSGMTGGGSFFPGGANIIEDAVDSIALLLRHQYSIGYYSNNTHSDKSWRKLKVQLHPSWQTHGLRVSAKEGYYALP
ncbi:MAG TPA: VWA domain-containing protein [Blastocatellia bacterium]|nr:VWA domain-containing protein [Blastocatellia bacterium]